MPPKNQNQNQSSPSSQNKPLSNYEVFRNAGYSSERHMALSYGLKKWPTDDDEMDMFNAIRDGLHDQMELQRAEDGE
jgi:hypothetical protein